MVRAIDALKVPAIQRTATLAPTAPLVRGRIEASGLPDPLARRMITTPAMELASRFPGIGRRPVHPGAVPDTDAESVRPPLLAVVAPMAKLSPRVRERPIEEMASTAMLRVVPAFPLVVAGWPRVTIRRRPPDTMEAFDHPAALRRLFYRPIGPAFLSEGSPESSLVDMLSAASLTSMRAVVRRFARYPWERSGQRELFESVRAISLGQEPAPGLWGTNPAVDAVRLRLLRSAARRGRAHRDPEIEWTYFLHWAGSRIAHHPEACSDQLIRVCGTSLAATYGYRRAFEFVAPLMAHQGHPLEHFDFMASLAMRGAVLGFFRPGLVAWLVPWGTRRHSPRAEEPDPWRFATSALRAFREKSQVAGVVHLTAALVCADVRERLAKTLGPRAAPWLRRRWASEVEGPSTRNLERAVGAVRSSAPAIFIRQRSRPLWGSTSGGPDVAALHGRLKEMLGASAVHGPELFLDDQLAIAAIFACLGYLPSAHAQLAAVAARPPLAEAISALRRAIERTPATMGLEAFELPWGRVENVLHQRIVRLPDPSVALGTPFWAVANRGELLSRLFAEGRTEEAGAIKTLLDRPALRTEMMPFWLLDDSERDREAVRRLALHLAVQDASAVSPRDCLRLVEKRCREIRPQSR